MSGEKDQAEQFPFAIFFGQLVKDGFAIETSDLQDSIRLLHHSDDSTVHEVKFKIAALICRNEREQQLFYQRFDSYFGVKKPTQGAVIPKAIPWRKVLILATVFVGLIALLISYLWFGYSSVSSFNYLPAGSVLPGDTIRFSAVTESDSSIRSVLKNYLNNIHNLKQVQVDWNFGDDTLSEKGLQTKHVFKFPGTYTIKVHFVSPALDTTHLDTIRVCDALPDLNALPSNVFVGETIDLPYDTASGKTIQWKVDGKEINPINSVYSVSFSTEGIHNVSARFEKQICPDSSQKSISVTSPQTYSLDCAFEPQPPITYSPKKWPSLLLFILTMLTVLISIVYLFHLIWMSQIREPDVTEEKEKKADTKEIHLPVSILPVFDLNFPGVNHLINQEPFVSKMSAQLSARIQSDLLTLSVQRSITETIRNEDFFTPVYAQRQSERDYLFLVEASLTRSPQVKLFKHLIETLRSNGTQLSIYSYFRDPTYVFRGEEEEQIPLSKLQDQHYQSTLFIWSEGSGLLNSYRDGLNDLVAALFSFWKQRILVSPIPHEDWSVKEEILARYFHLVPADISGLLHAVQLMDSENFGNTLQDQSLRAGYTVKLKAFQDINEIEAYLQDEELLQCFCALAVYPKVVWELLIAFIHKINPQKLTYPNLLKISRISWIRQAAFPVRTRLEMLKRLQVINELAARELVVELLDRTSITENTPAAEEWKSQLNINKFILYSNDPVKYAIYKKDALEFLNIYKAGKVNDTPLKFYLLKKDPDQSKDAKTGKQKIWETPLGVGKANVTLEQLLERDSGEPLRKLQRATRRVLFSLLTLCLALSVFTYYITRYRAELMVFTLPEKPSEFTLKLEKNLCYNKFGKGTVNRLDFTLDNGTDSLMRNIIDTLDADFIPVSVTLDPSKDNFMYVTLENSGGKQISYTGPITSRSATLSVKGDCSEKGATPDTVDIVFEKPQKTGFLKSLEQFLLTNNYIIGEIAQSDGITFNSISYSNIQDSSVVRRMKALAYLAESFLERSFVLDQTIPTSGRKGRRFTLRLDSESPEMPEILVQYNFQGVSADTNIIRSCLLDLSSSRTIINPVNAISQNVIYYFFKEDKMKVESISKCLQSAFKLTNFKIARASQVSTLKRIIILMTSPGIASCVRRVGPDTYLFKSMRTGSFSGEVELICTEIVSRMKKDQLLVADISAVFNKPATFIDVEDYELAVQKFFKRFGIQSDRISLGKNRQRTDSFSLCDGLVQVKLSRGRSPGQAKMVDFCYGESSENTSLIGELRKLLEKNGFTVKYKTCANKPQESLIEIRDSAFYDDARTILRYFESVFKSYAKPRIAFDINNPGDLSLYLAPLPKGKQLLFDSYPVGDKAETKFYRKLIDTFGIEISTLKLEYYPTKATLKIKDAYGKTQTADQIEFENRDSAELQIGEYVLYLYFNGDYVNGREPRRDKRLYMTVKIFQSREVKATDKK
jgi:PKD repeat protein